VALIQTSQIGFGKCHAPRASGEFSTYSPLKRLKREDPHPKKWEYPEISTGSEVGS